MGLAIRSILLTGKITLMKWIDSLKQRARALKRDTMALWFAYKDARTPWYAKVFSAVVVAYALSPST
jgi:uncharacterized membrane protein YkvA (DUF1232 family)